MTAVVTSETPTSAAVLVPRRGRLRVLCRFDGPGAVERAEALVAILRRGLARPASADPEAA